MPEETLPLEQTLESILFFKGEPVAIKELARILDTNEGEVQDALTLLEKTLQSRGLVIIRNGNEVTLGTHPSLAPLFEKLRKEEFTKELSKPALETLSVILYKEGATRGDIDYIRGVHSSVILRNLLIRGLIEKRAHTSDSRKYFYTPSFRLLEYMGVTSVRDLPEFDAISLSLAKRDDEEGNAEETSDQE